MSRNGFPLNPTRFDPWTLDLTSASAVMVAPTSHAGFAGEVPAGAFDTRLVRGFVIEVVPSNPVSTGSAVLELQITLDGSNYVSLGTSYQMTIPTGTPPNPNCFIVDNAAGMPFVRVAMVSTAATAGTATIFFYGRD